MAKIETIKQKILQLDQGFFQILCDEYLSKIGYKNIVSLGTKTGTRKTKKGTPDAYFLTSDGKYIFVEYTTHQSKLFSKMEDDIKKCLDVSKTNVPHNKISEIIYCHTSSNISAGEDNLLKEKCKDVGIKLTIIGIDTLANDLYLKYHTLARDFLEISLSTNQILSYDEFVKQYNANKMAAPIDTNFLFREKEINNLNEAFEKVDIVILKGNAGAGKTRLALHYSQNHSQMHNETLYCIHNRALPLYDDLRVFIDRPGNYFILVDDANQLSDGLQHIIRYAKMKPDGYNVKILITVRDYAIQKVINNVREISSFESINVGKFTEDEIKNLLTTVLGILNSNYLERILRIAEGNARIAILAGKIAYESKSLDSINDVSELYETYYGEMLKDGDFFSDNKLCTTAGIVAFLEAIHLDYIDPLMPILESKCLDRDNFIENLDRLHQQEIINIYYDKAVKFSEQCFSNYLLKYIFFDKKLISLSLMIKTCFQNYKERTITAVNTLLHIFRNENLYHFVSNEVKNIWRELSQENSPYFFEFLKMFFKVNPTETLCIIQKRVENEKIVNLFSDAIDTENAKNHMDTSNDIIRILGGFADTGNLPAALDLFFQYYLKRPDLYIQFYHGINHYFGVKKDSHQFNFYTQVAFLEKIREYSNDWKQEHITILFLKIAIDFLQLYFHSNGREFKHSMTVYQFPLVISEGSQKYRMLIWQAILIICKIDKYKEKIRKILNSYGVGIIEEISLPVLQFDLEYIKSILKLNFPKSDLQNCLIADHLEQIFTRINIPNESLFSEYLENNHFRLYRLLKGDNYKSGVDYDEFVKLKRQNIEQYVFNNNLEAFKQLIDTCYEINNFDNNAVYEIREGLGIAFDIISHKKDCYVDVIKYYIKKNTPTNLYPCNLVSTLFLSLSDSEVFHLIDTYEYSQKNEWLYFYYHELPVELITNKHLQQLYDFLAGTSDKTIARSSYRDINFLEKYSIIDKNAFIDGCKIILDKMEYSPFIVSIYFMLLFNEFRNIPQVVIQKFYNHFDLLEEIYCAMLSYDNHHDYNGKFLKEIYLVRPSILNRYICQFVKEDKCSFPHNVKCFFELDNFIEIYDIIFEKVIHDCKNPFLSISNPLKPILSVENKQDLLKKQDEWIQHCINQFYDNETKMFCLFSVIADLNNDRKNIYIRLFLEQNQIFDDFKKLPLIPISYGYAGSAVPLFSTWVEFLTSLLPIFIGLKWIEHKKYIENTIEYWRRQIEFEQINELLSG